MQVKSRKTKVQEEPNVCPTATTHNLAPVKTAEEAGLNFQRLLFPSPAVTSATRLPPAHRPHSESRCVSFTLAAASNDSRSRRDSAVVLFGHANSSATEATRRRRGEANADAGSFFLLPPPPDSRDVTSTSVGCCDISRRGRSAARRPDRCSLFNLAHPSRRRPHKQPLQTGFSYREVRRNEK